MKTMPFAICLVALVAGCASPGRIVDFKATYMTSDELARAKELANQGDSNAAFRVYEYYRDCTSDDALAEEWLGGAAYRRHPVAEFLFGKDLLDRASDEDDRFQAIFWLEESAKAGNKDAQHLLEQTRSPGANDGKEAPTNGSSVISTRGTPAAYAPAAPGFRSAQP